MTATKLFAASTAALIVACVAGWAAIPTRLIGLRFWRGTVRG